MATTSQPEPTTRHLENRNVIRGKSAARRAVAANSSHLRFTVADTSVELTLPPVDKLAFYAGLTAAAAIGVVEWPVALATGIGHLLADDRRNRTLHALGEALDAI